MPEIHNISTQSESGGRHFGLCELGRRNFVARAEDGWSPRRNSRSERLTTSVMHSLVGPFAGAFLPSIDRWSSCDFLREFRHGVATRRFCGLPTLMHFAFRRWHTRSPSISNDTFHSPNGLSFFCRGRSLPHVFSRRNRRIGHRD